MATLLLIISSWKWIMSAEPVSFVEIVGAIAITLLCVAYDILAISALEG